MKTTLLYVLLTVTVCTAQPDTTNRSIYRINRKYELTGSVLFLGASYAGFRALDRVATLSADEVAQLNPNQINGFDRPGAFRDPTRFDLAQRRSDLFLNISIASPLLLMADRRLRRDWLDLLTLYTVAHSINNIAYFATAFPIRRARPLTYNPGLPIDAKTGQAKSNSFYSGHVSFSTTATFFAAKVLTDYHHIRGWKRIGIFGIAAIPPVLVGLNRMEAGKHFRTDVLTGFAVGAACGILVPDLHRRVRRLSAVSLQPYYGVSGHRGLSCAYRF